MTFGIAKGEILVRTSPGTKLDAASTDAVVGFEVDEFDPASHSGWSVTVTGVARQATDPDQLAAVHALQLPRWAPGERDRVVAVSIELISGRRIVN